MFFFTHTKKSSSIVDKMSALGFTQLVKQDHDHAQEHPLVIIMMKTTAYLNFTTRNCTEKKVKFPQTFFDQRYGVCIQNVDLKVLNVFVMLSCILTTSTRSILTEYSFSSLFQCNKYLLIKSTLEPSLRVTSREFIPITLLLRGLKAGFSFQTIQQAGLLGRFNVKGCLYVLSKVIESNLAKFTHRTCF